MNAETILNAFWDEIRRRPDLPLQRYDTSEGHPGACQCVTELIVDASSDRSGTRALLLVGCAIRDAVGIEHFPVDEYLRHRPYMKVMNHGSDDGDEAPRDWLIYEGNGVRLSEGDWAAIVNVGVTLISDLHAWARAQNLEELWPRLAERLAWLPERLQQRDPGSAHRLRAACFGIDYRHRYSRRVGEIGVRLFRCSDHMDALRLEGCRIMNGHRPRATFSNVSDVKDVDIVVYEPGTMTIRAICEVKTIADRGRRSFEANGSCADVMRRASASGVFAALGVVRLHGPLPFSILEQGGAKICIEHLRAHANMYSVEYYPPRTYALDGSRFVIMSGQLDLLLE